MSTGVDLVECNLTRQEEQVRRTLNSQEAKVIILMREMAYQTITVKIENGKVIHKEQHRSIKD